MTGTDLLARFIERREDMLNDLAALVECESPSADLAAVWRCAELVTSLARRLGLAVSLQEVAGRPVVRIGGELAPVLMLAHLDTVHPMGATYNPWRIDGDRAHGLGTFDMKSGIVIGLHVLAELGNGTASLLINSDEEIGSEASVELMEKTAATARAVLVLEPSQDGALKTARKGVSSYILDFTGRAAHAGLEPEKGANALVALAQCVMTVSELSDAPAQTTVTPTVAAAGTVVNAIPAQATLTVDVRAMSAAEQRRVDTGVRALVPAVAGVTLTVRPGPIRPPLEASASHELFALAQQAATDIGLPPLLGVAAGGGSDGNFTAALGTPTLDGLGAVGAGAHSTDEWVEIDSLAERAALITALIGKLT